MRGPTPLFFFIVLFFQLLISWLAYRLAVRLEFFRTRSWGAVAYWLTAVAAIAILYSGRLIRLPADYLDGMYYQAVTIAYGWVVSQIAFVFLGACWLLVRWFVKKGRRAVPSAPAENTLSRRDFLKRSAVLLPLAAAGTGASGVLSAMNDMQVNRHTLFLPGWPAGADGFTVAQLSDLHVGPFFSLRKLDSVLAETGRAKPDLVVITGDFIDEIPLAEEAINRVSRFAATIPHGVFFCWGNHEYFRDKNKLEELLSKSDIRILENSSVRLLGGAQPVYLAGVDYPWADGKSGLQDKRRQFLQAALQEIPAGATSLLLSHHPDFIEEAFAAGIPLTLTGHTHGGQVAVFGRSLLPVTYRYMRGMYEQTGLYGYVHTGTGHWFPFRIGCPPEIAFFSLRAGKDK